MAGFARGKKALGLCDVCGFECKLHDLKKIVENGAVTSKKACRQCWVPDHPQNFVGRKKVVDYESLRDPRPDPRSADMTNIRWGWWPVYALEARGELGEITVSIS